MLFTDIESDATPRGHVDIIKAASELVASSINERVRQFAPAIHQSNFKVQWVLTPVANEGRHPITDAPMLQVALLMALWIGPTEDQQVLAVHPVLPSIFQASYEEEIDGMLIEGLKNLDGQFAQSGMVD